MDLLDGIPGGLPAHTGSLIAVLSTPHVLYYWIWTRPHQFLGTVKAIMGPEARPKACQIFGGVATAIKAIQISAYAAWVVSAIGGTERALAQNTRGVFLVRRMLC